MRASLDKPAAIEKVYVLWLEGSNKVAVCKVLKLNLHEGDFRSDNWRSLNKDLTDQTWFITVFTRCSRDWPGNNLGADKMLIPVLSDTRWQPLAKDYVRWISRHPKTSRLNELFIFITNIALTLNAEVNYLKSPGKGGSTLYSWFTKLSYPRNMRSPWTPFMNYCRITGRTLSCQHEGCCFPSMNLWYKTVGIYNRAWNLDAYCAGCSPSKPAPWTASWLSVLRPAGVRMYYF